MPLDDVAIYKYQEVELLFKGDPPSEIKDELNVYLKMTSQKQLLRISGGVQKLIAPNVNRTGYAKIA